MVALGAALLLPLAAHRGALRGLGDRWRPIGACAATEIAVPFTLIASMPLIMAVLVMRLSPEDRPTGLRLVGLFVGLGGVVALLGIDVAGTSSELLGAALILVAAVGYATAPIIIKRSLADLDPLGPVAVSLGVSALALLPAAIAAPPDSVPSLDALGSIAALGAVCTAGGLVLFFLLIAEAGPSRASVITYFNPLVAVALGLLVLDEHLGAASAVGLALILAGSWLATGGRVRMRRRAVA